MKTPYDAACRWKSHQLDQLRRELTGHYAVEEGWLKAQDDLAARLALERAAAANLPLHSADAFVTRCAEERARLAKNLADITITIAAVQDLMSAAFQDAKALDIAKERFVAHARAEASRLENAELDDVVSRRGQPVP